ncbi:unnamed protein product [Timema podura]|uniref:Breast cancer susceptibility 1 n=1 Tax=Timema podura TaxID=61482 RepID=A0ABN7P1W2_TIMPD|nr:unnamed protein product [Timema podura]
MEGCTKMGTTKKPNLGTLLLVKQEVILESEREPSSSSDDRGGSQCIPGAWTCPTFPKIKEEIESDSPSSADDLEMRNQCTSGTSIPDNFPKTKEEIKDELKGFGRQEPIQDNSDMFTTSNIKFEYNNDSSEPLSTVQSTFNNEPCFENSNLKMTKKINQTQTEINSSSSPSISDQQSINKDKLYCDKKQIIKNHECDLCG